MCFKKDTLKLVMITKVVPSSFHSQVSRFQRLTLCRGWLTRKWGSDTVVVAKC